VRVTADFMAERKRLRDEHRMKCFAKALAIAQDGFDRWILSGSLIIETLLHKLCTCPQLNERQVEKCVRKFLEDNKISLKEFAPFLRASLTGTTESVPIFTAMKVLGLRECAGRMRDPCRMAKYQLRVHGA
jgi:hypothetical protein